jgi:hypothetical protein
VPRNRKPSNAVTKGGIVGTLAGAVLEAGAAALGVPLPPGTGASLAGALVMLFTYHSRGGRQGEAD